MLLSAFALATVPQAPSPTLDRLSKFFGSWDTLSVDIAAKTDRFTPTAQARLIIDRPGRILFKSKWAPSDYTYALNEQNAIEIEALDKIYAEFAPLPRFQHPFSMVSRNPVFVYPEFLREEKPHDFFQQREWKDMGPVDLNGQKVNRVVASPMPNGKFSYELYVDGDGKLARVIRQKASHEGVSRITYDFSNYEVDKPQPENIFRLEPPTGYSPFNLPQDEFAVRSGVTFPVPQLKGTGKPAATAMYLLTAPECEVSERATPLVQKIKEAGVEMNVLTLAGAQGEVASGLRALPRYTVPKVNETLGLYLLGTPTLILVKDGRVARTWYGYDGEKLDEYVKDMKDALQELHATSQ